MARTITRTNLEAGERDLPERQWTVLGAIAWSHELLAPGGRTPLEQLLAADDW